MVHLLTVFIVAVVFSMLFAWYLYTRLLFVEIPGKIISSSKKKKLQLPSHFSSYSVQNVTASYVFNCLPYDTTGTVHLQSGAYSKGDKISLYVNSRKPSVAFVDYSYLSIWKRCYYGVLKLLPVSVRLFDALSSLKSSILQATKTVHLSKKKPSKREVKRKAERLKNRTYHRSELPEFRQNLQSNATMDRAYFIASLAKSCLILCFVIASAALLNSIAKDTLYKMNHTIFPAEIISMESKEGSQTICVSLSLGDELRLTADDFGDQYSIGDTVYVAVNRHSHDVILSKKNTSFNRVTFAVSTFFTSFTLVVAVILFICSIRSILVFQKVVKIKSRMQY